MDFPDHIISCHFKGWPESTLRDADGVLLQTLVVQGNEPSLSVKRVGAAYYSASKRVRMDAIDSGTIDPPEVFFPPSTQVDIPIHQFRCGDLAAGIVDPIRQAALDLPFFLPQFLQCRGIGTAPFLGALCFWRSPCPA